MIIKKTVKLRNNNERIYLYIHTYASNYCKLITVIENTHNNNTENRNYSCNKNITKFENKRTNNDKYNNNHDNNNNKINNKGL